MLEIILEEYKKLLEDLNRKCEETQKGLPMIPCLNKCYDCCKQIFPISFLEAYYISKGFRSLDRKKRRKLEKQAEKIYKKIPELEEKDFSIENQNWEEINLQRSSYSNFLNKINCNCPFLDENDNEGNCSVYEYRNHDCRSHGYSYDGLTREIIACFRFPEIFPQAENFINKAFDYNYRYQDKLKLDQKLIIHMTKNPDYLNIIYLTNPFLAMLKNFEEYDWPNFFSKRIKTKPAENKYTLIIDNEIF